MSPLSPLLVLVVREAGLRTTLIARLSMAGADLVTISDIDDPRIQRWIDKGPVLVLDAAALAEREGGEPALRADPRWRAIAVIGGEAQGPAFPPRISSGDAAAEIEAMLPAWGYPERWAPDGRQLFGNMPAAKAMRSASDRLRTSSFSIRFAR